MTLTREMDRDTEFTVSKMMALMLHSDVAVHETIHYLVIYLLWYFAL